MVGRARLLPVLESGGSNLQVSIDLTLATFKGELPNLHLVADQRFLPFSHKYVKRLLHPCAVESNFHLFNHLNVPPVVSELDLGDK